MELTLNGKQLTVKSISTAANEIITHIEDRIRGNNMPLKTAWNNFNNLCNGGIEQNALYTIGGISGSGKSAFVNELETDLIDKNTQEDIIVLNFSLEMQSSKQVGRKLSGKLRKTTTQLYSASTKLDAQTLDAAKKEIEKINKYPIYYVEDSVTVDDVVKIITHFQTSIAKNKWLIVIFDHTLLLEGSGKEKNNIDDLQKAFIRLRKLGKTSIVQLVQLNRAIESTERINNPSSHYPMRSDLSTSDFMYQSSDYVGVLHRPEILGISAYGTKLLPTKNMLYLHILKNRDGSVGILPFKNELQYNTITEFKSS